MIHRFSLPRGNGTRVQKHCVGTEMEWTLTTAGDGSYVSDANFEFGSTKCHVLIGRYCSIGHRIVFEMGLNHNYNYVTTYPFEDFDINDTLNINHFDDANKNQIIIGNDVWIGCDVTIMGGVRIGNGAVIGAGTVVAKDIPPYSIVVGNPARVIKYRFEQDVIQRLQRIKWWYWPVDKIKAAYPLMKNIDRFLELYDDCFGDDTVDETVQALRDLKEDGYCIYYMVADFNMADGVWRSVLTEYLNTFQEDSKVLLVVETGRQPDEALMIEMAKMVEDKGDKAPIVVTHNADNISKALLRLVDTYITTKDEASSVVVDLLWDMDVKIVYGLDYGGKIFKKTE
ncbi:virginiamycin A acetyltransferase [Anaerovibrio lipolyticus DSM 3074]|uniref:Virginiamycin A acetyltransferase n=1 Tax=Anaerovibrio lipolyticus DSM 3074 TaxID=1120997 RepID=A0A1M6EDC8_9FIRM|nr:CatB-related O-acetyltransferase [Anaerovibrio lipolyticus]SHI83507.1 virginiamycin A acetyltransferase [Anaerovibrio lipolyticus DSM 3074]